MKKMIFVLLAAIMLLLVSCGSGENMDNTPVDSPSQSEQNVTSSKQPEDEDGIMEVLLKGDIPIYSGWYVVGDNFDAGAYTITCTEADYALGVLVFENIEAYNNYMGAERITNGQELAAIEQNAIYDHYIQKDETYFVGLNKGNIVLVDNGEGYLRKYNFGTTVDRDKLWFDGNTDSICTGVYFVGKDIDEAGYKLTCDIADWSMSVTVFKSADDYTNYHKSSRFTGGEEDNAIQKYALSNSSVHEEESCFIDLKEGYVLKISGGTGSLEMIDTKSDATESASQNASTLLAYPGVYFVGEYLNPNTYINTCTAADWSQQILVFETREDYLNYHRTSRFTNGEELAAIEQNALSDFYIDQDESCYLNLRQGMVLIINDGIGFLDRISTNWAVK